MADEQEKTLLAQKDIEQRDIRIRALSALISEQQQSLNKEQLLTADARAEVALLKEQLAQLHSQLTEISSALSVSEAKRTEQEEKIHDLGNRLNIELARKVNELERYRSDFFGRLRTIVGDNPVIRIEGDRFLLQAELLFPSGTAELGEQGKAELKKVAAVLLQLIPTIPRRPAMDSAGGRPYRPGADPFGKICLKLGIVHGPGRLCCPLSCRAGSTGGEDGGCRVQQIPSHRSG